MQTDKKAQQDYQKLVEKSSPPSPLGKNCVRAFLSGGLICSFGQFLLDTFLNRGYTEEAAGLLVSITLIGIAAILTGLGLYGKLGKYCGAGTLVPITGFSNSVCAPAIEFKKEGITFGMTAKMFIIAGPVIVYGTLTSMVVGLVYYFMERMM